MGDEDSNEGGEGVVELVHGGGVFPLRVFFVITEDNGLDNRKHIKKIQESQGAYGNVNPDGVVCIKA